MAILHSPISPLLVSTSPFPFSPAKTLTSSISTTLILRASPLILHPPSSSSIFGFVRPIPASALRPTRPSQRYVYPDPMPEFSESETEKFKTELSKRLSKDKETFGDDLHNVVDVCSEIFSNFMHKEYGGPGTLLVEPFTDMLVALKEKKLPGAPLAARAALLWAQKFVDEDWEFWNKAVISSPFNLHTSRSSSSTSSSNQYSLPHSSSPSSFSLVRCGPPFLAVICFPCTDSKRSSLHRLIAKRTQKRHICRAAEYKFPDPIPEFADSETEKFKTHLLKRLSKRTDIFGDSVDDVVGVCTEIFDTFLHTHYGGPGTLLVLPFIDMADALEERGLPGGPQAARAAIKWATDHVNKDWKEWNSGDGN